MGFVNWVKGVLRESWEETKAYALDNTSLNIIREVAYILSHVSREKWFGETPSPIFVNFNETVWKRTQITKYLEANDIPVHKAVMSGKFLIVDVSNDDRDLALSVLACAGIPFTLESPSKLTPAIFDGLHAMGLVSAEEVQQVKSRRGEYGVKNHGEGVKLAKRLRERGLKARVKGTLFTGFKVETW